MNPFMGHPFGGQSYASQYAAAALAAAAAAAAATQQQQRQQQQQLNHRQQQQQQQQQLHHQSSSQLQQRAPLGMVAANNLASSDHNSALVGSRKQQACSGPPKGAHCESGHSPPAEHGPNKVAAGAKSPKAAPSTEPNQQQMENSYCDTVSTLANGTLQGPDISNKATMTSNANTNTNTMATRLGRESPLNCDTGVALEDNLLSGKRAATSLCDEDKLAQAQADSDRKRIKLTQKDGDATVCAPSVKDSIRETINTRVGVDCDRQISERVAPQTNGLSAAGGEQSIRLNEQGATHKLIDSARPERRDDSDTTDGDGDCDGDEDQDKRRDADGHGDHNDNNGDDVGKRLRLLNGDRAQVKAMRTSQAKGGETNGKFSPAIDQSSDLAVSRG